MTYAGMGHTFRINLQIPSLQDGNEEVVCKNHLILGQHLYKDLEGRDFILYGGAKFRSKDNKVTRWIKVDITIKKALQSPVSQNYRYHRKNHEWDFTHFK